ncbi:unnamed protein product [Lactuca virosa]|uniref:Uncharacterized protein n=1 Tax=Lactuca virosa TaxID=75947 RepID=A0AAU9MXA7_9ASTR|nr:unnamed protein product [Lactuca virosa]
MVVIHLKSLEMFSNCEWLWKVTLTGNYELGPLAGDILLNSMLLQIWLLILYGNAKDYFISINISNIDIWSGCSVLWVDWVKTYNMLLPHDWYNHFSGILMFLKSNGNLYSLNPGIIIKLGVDEDFQSELGQESNETLETQSQEKTYVGYVSFSSLRHTTCLNSTYNIISFSQDKEKLYGDDYKFRAVLVPKKYLFQTTKAATNSLQFWDEEEVYDRKTFTIQHDSNSCIEILWDPLSHL